MSAPQKPKIQVFFDEKCLLHSPNYEILSGNITPWFECPDRIKSIKSHLEKYPDEFPIVADNKDFGMEPILEIHNEDYIEYLQTIYKEWVEGGGNPEAGVVPEVMLHKKLLPEGFKPDLDELHTIGKVGMYHFDLSSTITADTWTSAYAAVQTALAATETALANDPATTGVAATFALIRPPGHHATTGLCGGYCYLNNVMICASHALSQIDQIGRLKCVIIDIDFHHGNGVDEILRRQPSPEEPNWRKRCQYISLHAHPEYPYYTSHLDHGLPKDVEFWDYNTTLFTEFELATIWCTGEGWRAEETLVLVSMGLDTLSSDPVGGFNSFTGMEHYELVGESIGDFVAQVNGRTAFLLEGGYVVEKLGECVEAVFRGFMRGVKPLLTATENTL